MAGGPLCDCFRAIWLGLTERGGWFQSIWKPKEGSGDEQEKERQSVVDEGREREEKSEGGGGWFAGWMRSKLPGEWSRGE